MLDLRISGALVYDGTGRPPVVADIGVEGERIAAVGDLSRAEAAEHWAAAGRSLAPGFIDVHSHSDALLLVEPAAPSSIFQGVTTELVGNCGTSAAPRAGACRLPSDWRGFAYPGSWRTVADYRALLAEARPAVNVAMLIGHNTVRAGVMGYTARPATPDERAGMRRLLEQALDEGGRGFSTGLIYAPGRCAAPGEIAELAGLAARRGGLYASHMRSESARLLEALDETLGIARRTGGRVQVSHLKAAGARHGHLLDAALEKLRAAREEGLDVAADRYPYTASATSLDSRLPDWAAEGTPAEVLARLRDPAARRRIRAELHAQLGGGWDRVTVGSTWSAATRPFRGRPLPEAARAWGVDPGEAFLRVLEADALRTGGIFHGMSEEDLWRILAEPFVMLGSDGSVRSPTGPLSRDMPHPRHYGAFPRFLRASLDGRTVPPEEAIRKMTSLPARRAGLAHRGEVRPGAYADLVLFDPARVRDTATYADPHRLAEGVCGLVVNGVPTLREGRPCGGRGGRFLAPGET